MSDEIRETILSALRRYAGDNLERAELEFRGLTEDEMQQECGQSGRARQGILDGYHEHRRKVNAAIDWIRSLS